MSRSRSEIEHLMGGPLTPGLDALDDQDLATLASAIGEATVRQEADLASAIESGLDIVPRVLRGAVRKALFG